LRPPKGAPWLLAVSLIVLGQLQVIFTSIPLWSAGLAYIFLGEQAFGPLGWFGAACIIAAGLIIASSNADTRS
jgi:drug/metabolite transporter (DMT)-like permease